MILNVGVSQSTLLSPLLFSVLYTSDCVWYSQSVKTLKARFTKTFSMCKTL
uniref:Reverse transcriptase domain-containing protein n=1 Tax=Anguilla anguilla TaxID=7936 RepID=A0A0E9UT37_ANGAN